MEALQQFDPNNSSQQLAFWLAILITALALGGLLFLLKKKAPPQQYTRNMLMAMLLFFVCLIAASAAFFTKWSQLKTGKVYLYEDSIKTAYGMATFDQIKKASIHNNDQPSMVNPTIKRKTVKMLMIEETNGKMHILSEENYEINEIFGQLRTAIDKWKESRQ